MFTFGSDVLRGWPSWAVCGLRRARRNVFGQGRLAWDAGVRVGPVSVLPGGAVRGLPAGSGRGACGGQVGEGLAAPAAGPGWQAGCGAAGVVGLAGGPGVQDSLVADGQQAGEPEHDRGQAGEPGPAAGDVVAGGVL